MESKAINFIIEVLKNPGEYGLDTVENAISEILHFTVYGNFWDPSEVFVAIDK